MSNVYSNTSFAVLSVMETYLNGGNTYAGSTCFVQRKPEVNYGNLTPVTFMVGNPHNLDQEDFNIQSRFDANVVPKIHSELGNTDTYTITLSNSNISVKSYSMNGTEIT